MQPELGTFTYFLCPRRFPFRFPIHLWFTAHHFPSHAIVNYCWCDTIPWYLMQNMAACLKPLRPVNQACVVPQAQKLSSPIMLGKPPETPRKVFPISGTRRKRKEE